MSLFAYKLDEERTYSRVAVAADDDGLVTCWAPYTVSTGTVIEAVENPDEAAFEPVARKGKKFLEPDNEREVTAQPALVRQAVVDDYQNAATLRRETEIPTPSVALMKAPVTDPDGGSDLTEPDLTTGPEA